MSTTSSATTARADRVEDAIETYLGERPYSSRFRGRDLVEHTSLSASAKEIKHILVDLAEQGHLEHLSYTSGASTYRTTPDGKFGDDDQDQEGEP